MIRTLLATTALAALFTTGAIAQDAMAPADPAAPATTEAPAPDAMAPAAPDAMAPAAPDAMAPAPDAMAPADAAAPATTDVAPATDVESGAMEETEIDDDFDMATGYMAVDTDNLGSELIDQPVYSSAGDDAEEIGNITDLIFSEDGTINAVVIGVGGFLGIGEKSVAVDFGALEFTVAADNTERWVVPTTADALTTAPEFVWEEDEPADDDMTDEAMDPAMAPADPAMAPADPAAAPATN